nr:uncharacterized protein LOC118878243 isoform X3 [Drosophila suzukii]
MELPPSPERDFEGEIGVLNKIVLKVYQLDDLVFNRTEAHYDTGLVAGLVSIAVAIGDYETSEVSERRFRCTQRGS